MFCEYLRKQKQVTHEVRFKSELADVQDFPYILSSCVWQKCCREKLGENVAQDEE